MNEEAEHRTVVSNDQSKSNSTVNSMHTCKNAHTQTHVCGRYRTSMLSAWFFCTDE